MRWRGRTLRVWWRWLATGRKRWCTGEPLTVDGVMACGCVWDVGYMASQCDQHTAMALRYGLVLRDGDLVRQEEL